MTEKSYLSIIGSVFNEENNIDSFCKNLDQYVSNHRNVELIFVDDGSTDQSVEKIRSNYDKFSFSITLVKLIKNSGHDAAMIAGLSASTGEVIIFMDTDMQHPHSVITPMVDCYERHGVDVVLTKRTSNHGTSFTNQILSKAFYKTLNLFSSESRFEQGASDFFLISEKVKRCILENQHQINCFLRGFIQAQNFRTKTVDYTAEKRQHGKSKYNYYDLTKLAYNAIFMYSNKPLAVGYFASMVVFIFLAFFLGYSLYQYLFRQVPPGYTTIIFLFSFLFGVNFLILGIMSKYISLLYNTLKQKNIYYIDMIEKSSPNQCNSK